MKGVDQEKKPEPLFTFLKQTKEGTFAEIDEDCFQYARIQYQREDDSNEMFYYSTS